MAISDEVLKKIEEEIVNDPENMGYKGKTEDEIAALLNSPVVKQRVVEEVSAPRINIILTRIADTPNIVDKIDFKDSAIIAAEVNNNG